MEMVTMNVPQGGFQAWKSLPGADLPFSASTETATGAVI